mmetsp:Transcript_41757/g.67053  ORF Transcript_41757/g.67053 Transcript_41757/m.67053 type:complete len:781 (+) Transcript_41757:257-2599(+)
MMSGSLGVSLGKFDSSSVFTNKLKGRNTRVERLFVTGDPDDLRSIIQDARVLNDEREAAKARADDMLDEVLLGITENNATTERLRSLGGSFLRVDSSDYLDEHRALVRIVDEVLALRPDSPRLCSLFLFAISPYTRHTLATEHFHDALQKQELSKSICSNSLAVGTFSGSPRSNGSVSNDSNSAGCAFEEELLRFQDRLSELHRRIEEKQRNVSLLDRKSRSSSPNTVKIQELRGTNEQIDTTGFMRCRICEEVINRASSADHFEDCLEEYKQTYRECRLEGILHALDQRKSDQSVDRYSLSVVETIKEVLMVAGNSLENHTAMEQARERLYTVLNDLKNCPSHNILKAYVLESMDLIQVDDDPSLAEFASTPPRPHVGRRGLVNRPSVKDFDFMKIISRGSVGGVFLAIKKRTGDLYAIKVMNKAEVVKKNLVARIVAERNVLARANCPFVVKFFFSFETQQRLFLAMEFVQGGDLLSLITTRGALQPAVVHKYTAEIVVALKYLHECLNVCHRDLKPDNILIDKYGHIKLTDFGLSKVGIVQGLEEQTVRYSSTLFAADSKPTSSRNRRKLMRSQVGTPDYMAPEILLGIGHDFACDWWSLGIIMYEMLFEIPPFSDETPECIFNNILSGDIPTPDEEINCPPTAWELITDLLQPVVSERLGSKHGASDVQQHSFFRDVNWSALEIGDFSKCDFEAPFIPNLSSETDTSYFFDDEDDDQNDEAPRKSSGDSSNDQYLPNSHLEYEEKNSIGPKFPGIDFAYSQLSNLQSLNLAALSHK